MQEVKTNRKNLSKKEIKAMEDLKKREDVVICKADKGGAVVICSVNDYIIRRRTANYPTGTFIRSYLIIRHQNTRRWSTTQ